MTEWKALSMLFPGPRRLTITALFAEPDRWWSAAELADRAGMSVKSARQHFLRLLGCGLICEKQEHGKTWFQPDHRCPIFPELASIVTKLTSQPGCGATILVVEDQPATARITCILLESWGYRVLETYRPQEAIRVFEAEPEIHLLLSDIHMPEMNGQQLASELLRRTPELRVVLMSGDSGADALPRGCAFLQKPFNPSGLARIVRRELDRRVSRNDAINKP